MHSLLLLLLLLFLLVFKWKGKRKILLLRIIIELIFVAYFIVIVLLLPSLLLSLSVCIWMCACTFFSLSRYSHTPASASMEWNRRCGYHCSERPNEMTAIAEQWQHKQRVLRNMLEEARFYSFAWKQHSFLKHSKEYNGTSGEKKRNSILLIFVLMLSHLFSKCTYNRQCYSHSFLYSFFLSYTHVSCYCTTKLWTFIRTCIYASHTS